MTIRKANFRNDEFYHVYNEGVENIVIFRDKQDFFQFLKMLELFNNTISKGSSVNYQRKTLPEKKSGKKVEWEDGKNLVEIIAYSLIKNHFHLILKQVSDKGISKFMQKVQTGYAMYFNKKYKRSGSLYIRRFESEHILNNDSLEKIGAYVNLNHKIHNIKVESFKLTSSENINKMTYVSSWSEYMKKSNWKICEQKYLVERVGTNRKYRNFAETLVQEIIEDKKIYIKK